MPGMPGSPPRDRSLRRITGALAASAWVHAWVAAYTPGPERMQERAVHPPAPLTARLALSRPAPEEEPQPKPRERGREEERPARVVPPPPPTPVALRPGVVEPEAPADPSLYEAWEVDVLPRLAHPFAAGGPDGAENGDAFEVRLEVVVGSRGAVTSVRVLGDAHDETARAIRRQMAATVFSPARKDGRAVASRLVIVVTGRR